jgi:hypothetical protein
VALAAYLATHSTPAAAAAAAMRKVGNSVRRLSEEEAELVRIIIHASPGNPYAQPVSETLVRERHHAPERLDDLLDALQDKGIIKSVRGSRVQLTF